MKFSYAATAALAACLGILPVCSGALAQADQPATASDTPAARADRGGVSAPTSRKIEQITVSVRRREELQQRVPVAATIYTGDKIEQSSFVDLRDLQQQAPNLFVFAKDGSPSGNFIQIRSQRQANGLITLDPAVGVYVDGIYLARSFGLNFELGDLERIEILKGPQGTLFGRNTTGGAIQLVSRLPADNFGGRISASYGEHNEQVYKATLNLPLSSKLKLRVNGMFKNRDGFSRSVTTGQELETADRFLFRAILLWQPTDNFELQLTGDGLRARESGAMFRLQAVDFNNPVQAFVPGVGAASAAQLALQAENPRRTTADALAFAHSDVYGAGAIAKLDLGEVTIKSLTGYRSIEDRNFFDSDATAAPLSSVELALTNYWSISQELQAFGTSGAFDWIVGLYYFHEKGDDLTDAFLPLFGVSPNTFDGTGTNTSYAIYAQGDYRVPSIEGLRFTFGFRWTWDKRRLVARNTVTVPPFGTLCALYDGNGFPLDPCTRTDKTSFDQPSWTLGVNYQVNDDVMVYFTSRRGFRSGGFNNRAVDEAGFTPFDPEKITDFEVGVKSEFDVGEVPVRLNLAAFYALYDNVQRLVVVPASNATLQTVVFNAAKAKTYGGELELFARLTDRLSFSTGFGVSIGTYDEFIADLDGDGVPNDNSDLEFPGPKYQINASLRYEVPNFGNMEGNLAFQFDVSWNSTVFDGQTRFPTTGDYAIINARIEWSDIGGSGLTAAVFARNALNKLYAISSVGSAYEELGTVTELLGPPRIIGVELSYKFGDF